MDFRDEWERIVIELSQTISRSNIITWFHHTAILEVKDNTIYIGVPREFGKTWHVQNSADIILKTAKKSFPDIINIEFEVNGRLESGGNVNSIDAIKLVPENEKQKPKIRKLPRKAEVKIDGEFISKRVDEKFTLRNFIIGEENQLAHAACRAVADAPGGTYNPLFIYGSVGLGKTHLLQATANEIMKKHEEMIVVYLTTENFIAEVVEAIQKRKMEKIRQKYRKVDVFILDDIQFLAGKDRTQEVFFHLFNDLYNAKKQIILTSDKPPLELELTEDRLKSRFSMGMIADVKLPDFETRLAICKTKAQELSIILDDDILNFIAFNAHHSIRELEGVILQTKAQIELQGLNPTVKSIAQTLKKLNKEQKIMGLDGSDQQPSFAHTMEDIIKNVCEFYSVPVTEVLGASRSREFMIPRQVSMYLIKHHLGNSLQSIGEHFNGRDHTSIMHALKKVEEKKQNDALFWRDLKTLETDMGL